eukprot:Skav203638  [mRNA]  locus=scaffold1120:160878:161183:- [translate_table: standard]
MGTLTCLAVPSSGTTQERQPQLGMKAKNKPTPSRKSANIPQHLPANPEGTAQVDSPAAVTTKLECALEELLLLQSDNFLDAALNCHVPRLARQVILWFVPM